MYKATLIKGKTYSFDRYVFDIKDSNLKSQIIDDKFVGLLEKTGKFKIEKITEEKKIFKSNIFIITDFINNADGFGRLIKGLLKKYSSSKNLDLKNISAEGYVIQVTAPTYFKKLQNYKKRIGFTMFETTKIPKDWPKICKETCDILIVPAEEVKKVFKNCEVDIPIYVVPLWVDNCYQYFKRPKRKIFTFLFIGQVDTYNRKGWLEAVKAFKQEFRNEENVRFIIKCPFLKLNSAMIESIISDDRIKIIREVYSDKKMYNLLKNSDCFVFPTHGEGFGLPPLEAMATGLPTIVTDWMGCSEFVNEDICYPIRVDKLEDALYPDSYGDIGKWAHIDIYQVRKLMRQVYENREEAFKKGKKASEYVDKNFRFDNFINKFEKIIKNEKNEKNKNGTYIYIKHPNNNSLSKVVSYVSKRNFYAGGRVYFKHIIKALIDLGIDITLFTDREHNKNSFNFNDVPYVISKQLPEADKYIAMMNDYIEIEKASLKYNKPVTFFIFDSLTNIMKYSRNDDGRLNEEKVFYNSRYNFLKRDNIDIITISEFSRNGIKEWLNKDSKIIFPCIDYELIKSIPKQKKKNWITFISRVDVNKQPFLLLDIFEHFKNEYELHIITSFIRPTKWGESFKRLADRSGVKFHWNTNEETKYKVIKQSAITINTSCEEGFGIFVIESQACGVPFVGFDLPSYREIEKVQPRGLYLANNKAEFIDLLNVALEDGDFEPVCKFDFKYWKKQIRKVLV